MAAATDGTRKAGSRSSSEGTDLLTAEEFSLLISKLCVAVGATYWDAQKKRSLPSFGAAELEVYWLVLKDIPAEILREGMLLVASRTTYRGLPPAGSIRACCAEVGLGLGMTSAEAWEIARIGLSKMSRYDPARMRLEILALPDIVQEVGKQIGWMTLGDMETQFARAAFCKAYEQLVELRKKRLTLPGAWPANLRLPNPDRGELKRLGHGEAEGQSGDGDSSGGD
jgi:hypothetical protein